MPDRHQRWVKKRKNLPLLSRFTLSFSIDRLYAIRNSFAAYYLTGEGFEIGAQQSPLQCKKSKRIQYIDYLSRNESAEKYNLNPKDCVEVDILADANDLSHLPQNAASFIIANHVLEHCPDPIGTLTGWLHLLQQDGVLYLTLPHYTSNEFDFEKHPASLEHLIKDSRENQKGVDITREHIFEHIHLIDEIDPSESARVESRYREIIKSGLHTHYHVFDHNTVIDMLHHIHRSTPICVTNHLTLNDGFELLFIVTRLAPSSQEGFKVKSNHLVNLRILLPQALLYLKKRFLQIWRK